MSVTVDHRPLAAENLGLKTLGQVLAHLQKDNRLVVARPDRRRRAGPRSPAAGEAISRRRAHGLHRDRRPATDGDRSPRRSRSQLDEADRLKTEAADLLQRNQNAPAMEKLAGCFTTWQHAQESILKTAQLLRIDLTLVRASKLSMHELFNEFAKQLKAIRVALESRDFVTLSDLLLYETTETSAQWRDAIATMRKTILPN
jgi:hypothetical protein